MKILLFVSLMSISLLSHSKTLYCYSEDTGEFLIGEDGFKIWEIDDQYMVIEKPAFDIKKKFDCVFDEKIPAVFSCTEAKGGTKPLKIWSEKKIGEKNKIDIIIYTNHAKILDHMSYYETPGVFRELYGYEFDSVNSNATCRWK